MALNKTNGPAAALGLLLAALFALAPAPGCQVEPTATVDHGERLFRNYCAQCHGADGLGNPDIAAPAIAGLPDWYVVEQLGKFRKSVRGAHFDDLEGLRMRPMSLTLRTDIDVQAAAMYVATLPPTTAAPIVEGGEAEKGKNLYVTCNACHGPEAAGNQQLGAPPLVLQNDWYLVKQIGKFKAGIRGANPQDLRGGQMRPMAATLPDDQAVKDVIAYIQTLRKH